MSLAGGIVMDAATAAATYAFEIADGASMAFTGYGFSGSDAIMLQAKAGNGAFADYVDATTAQTVTLSLTGNALIVSGPFIGRWSKGVTTGAVGLRVAY